MKNLIILFLILIGCGNSENGKKLNGDEQRDLLEEVLTLSLDANQLTQSPKGETVFELSAEVEEEIVKKFERSIDLGESLNPKFLKFIKGDLPQQFNNNLILGMKKYLKGLKSKDINLQIEGNKLTMNWGQYWEKNKDSILNKMYPEN